MTGADVAPDRSHVVLRTYTDAFEWAIPAGGTIASAFAAPALPTVTRLPAAGQGEAIAYSADSRSWYLTSERTADPVAGTPAAAPLDRVGPAPVDPVVPELPRGGAPLAVLGAVAGAAAWVGAGRRARPVGGGSPG